ncbi:hypothetical protein ACN47E_001791 [Coniothyrium glycines]
MAASFWASRPDSVKSIPSLVSPSQSSPPPTSSITTPPKKPGVFLKPASNGVTNGAAHSSPANGKKSDWADEDEDEAFYASLKAGVDPHKARLQEEVALKGDQILELERKLAANVVRIEELQGIVQNKDNQIVNFEASVKSKDETIELLKKDGNEQFLYVEELVSEIGEKDRRITALEVELVAKSALIQQLQATLGGHPQPRSSPKIASHDTTTKSETSFNRDASLVARSSIEMTAEVPTTTEPSVSAAAETPVAEKVAGPTVNNATSPVFLSPSTLKAVAPPPMPKRLVFPNEQHFLKLKGKAAKLPAARPAFVPKDRSGSASSWGVISKATRVKTDEVPKIEPSLDIRRMTHAQRVLYANGPEVEVKLGTVKLATLPKYILMQCSSKAYKHFKGNEEATEMSFAAESMDAEAVQAHCNWMNEMTYQGRVYSVTLNTDPKHDHYNLKLCRASRVMGLNNTYVGHFTKQFCDRIRAETTTTEFMELVCAHAYPENDPVFDCLANSLIDQAHRGTDGAVERLQKLGAKYPVFKTKVDQIEQRILRARKGTKPRGGTLAAL